MDYILETKRLRLTPLALSDVYVAVEIFTNPAVLKFVGDAMTEESIRREMPLWTRRGGD